MTDNEIIKEVMEAYEQNLGAGCYVGDLLRIINRLQAEIEMLEDAKNAYKDIVDTCEKGAVKEFWEKLKVEGKKRVDYYTPDGCDNYFRNGTLCGYVAMKEVGDSILKEMVGDAQ